MGKVGVKGSDQHPLFAYLTTEAGGLISDAIKWNFTKFLIDRQGQVVKRFASIKKPADIAKHIEKLL